MAPNSCLERDVTVVLLALYTVRWVDQGLHCSGSYFSRIASTGPLYVIYRFNALGEGIWKLPEGSNFFHCLLRCLVIATVIIRQSFEKLQKKKIWKRTTISERRMDFSKRTTWAFWKSWIATTWWPCLPVATTRSGLTASTAYRTSISCQIQCRRRCPNRSPMGNRRSKPSRREREETKPSRRKTTRARSASIRKPSWKHLSTVTVQSQQPVLIDGCN